MVRTTHHHPPTPPPPPRQAPLSRDLSRIRKHGQEERNTPGQAGESTPKLFLRACREDAPSAVGELVQRQAAAHVVLSQRDCSTLAITVAGEHGLILAPSASLVPRRRSRG
jgi:hypothetical protein